MGLFTSTTWPTHHVTHLYIELVNPNTYFLLVLRLSSNGQAQTWKALYINVMFSNDIKLMNFLLAALTVLRKLIAKSFGIFCTGSYISNLFIIHVILYIFIFSPYIPVSDSTTNAVSEIITVQKMDCLTWSVHCSCILKCNIFFIHYMKV